MGLLLAFACVPRLKKAYHHSLIGVFLLRIWVVAGFAKPANQPVWFLPFFMLFTRILDSIEDTLGKLQIGSTTVKLTDLSPSSLSI